MKISSRPLLKLLVVLSFCLFASSMYAIEGVFVARNALTMVAERETDPAKKAEMLKAIALTSRSIEIKGDTLVTHNGPLAVPHKITDYKPFLLGTATARDGGVSYCAIYVQNDDTLVVGETEYTRSK